MTITRMQLMIYLVFLAVCSGCASAPKIAVCLSNPRAGGMNCAKDGEALPFVEYQESDKYVCSPPEDIKILLEYLKRQASSALGD